MPKNRNRNKPNQARNGEAQSENKAGTAVADKEVSEMTADERMALVKENYAKEMKELRKQRRAEVKTKEMASVNSILDTAKDDLIAMIEKESSRRVSYLSIKIKRIESEDKYVPEIKVRLGMSIKEG